MDAATVENSMEVPQKKKKIELPYDPGIPFLGLYPDKTIFQKDTCILCSCSTIHNSQDMETT